MGSGPLTPIPDGTGPGRAGRRRYFCRGSSYRSRRHSSGDRLPGSRPGTYLVPPITWAGRTGRRGGCSSEVRVKGDPPHPPFCTKMKSGLHTDPQLHLLPVPDPLGPTSVRVTTPLCTTGPASSRWFVGSTTSDPHLHPPSPPAPGDPTPPSSGCVVVLQCVQRCRSRTRR